MNRFISLLFLLFSLHAGAQSFTTRVIPDPPAADDHAGQVLQASTFTSSATAGTSAVIAPTDTKVCLNGSTCTVYLTWDGTTINLVGATVTTPSGLTLSPTRTDTASSYTANAAAGDKAFIVANTGAKVCIHPTNSFLCMYELDSVFYFPAGASLGAGQNMTYDSWAPKQTGLPPIITGTHGFRNTCVTGALDTCDATLAAGGTQVNVCASTDGTSRTRKCQCTSDGNASPAYAWVTLTPGVTGSPVGTTTSCPVVTP